MIFGTEVGGVYVYTAKEL